MNAIEGVIPEYYRRNCIPLQRFDEIGESIAVKTVFGKNSYEGYGFSSLFLIDKTIGSGRDVFRDTLLSTNDRVKIEVDQYIMMPVIGNGVITNDLMSAVGLLVKSRFILGISGEEGFKRATTRVNKLLYPRNRVTTSGRMKKLV